MADGSWQGQNLTYYGLFNALALCTAVSLVLILTGAAGVPVPVFVAITGAILGICLPASSLIARWVEKKPSTFSVGAASFLGIVLGPWLVVPLEMIARRFTGTGFDPMAVLSAMMVAYALGEGIGRLACISFGCCYGKPMDQIAASGAAVFFVGGVHLYRLHQRKSPMPTTWTERRFSRFRPLQRYCTAPARWPAPCFTFPASYAWAFFLCLFVTQIWRFFSEFLRADYRGDRKISIYQIMSLATVPYGLLLPFLFPGRRSCRRSLRQGCDQFWHPATILSPPDHRGRSCF